MDKEPGIGPSNAAYEPYFDELDSVLDDISLAIKDDSDCTEALIEEYDDFSRAISLEGDQKALDSTMGQLKLWQCLNDVAKLTVRQLGDSDRVGLVCCFTGQGVKKAPWLANRNDYRTKRLEETLRELVNQLSIQGVDHYIVGNAEGFDAIAVEAVLNSRAYLKMLHVVGGVEEEWQPAWLEIAVPFKDHDMCDLCTAEIQKKTLPVYWVAMEKNRIKAFFVRDEHMVDNADIVIALLDDEDSHSVKGDTDKALAYTLEQGKPAIVFSTRWFEDGWPDIDGVKIVPARALGGESQNEQIPM